MRKLTGFWFGYVCLVLLTACVRKDEPLGPETNTAAGEVGEAQLVLPALPPGFLAKMAADTVDTTRAVFILTITGSGMAPRRQAWRMDSASQTVTVTGIPVGYRLFTGQLDLGGRVAYADSAWALIEKGKTAFVHLKLGSATGNAQVCVEIEGLPLPAGCKPEPKIPDVTGCWSFRMSDSAMRDTAILNIRRADSSSLLVATLQFGSIRDTAYGNVQAGGWVSLGLDSTSGFLFTAQVDSVGAYMEGKFFLRRMPPMPTQYVRAMRIPCPSGPDPVPVDSLSCWNAAQVLGQKSATGRFIVLDRNANLYGLFQWSGYADMPVKGFRSAILSPISSVPSVQAYYLYGALPPGMATTPRSVPDSVHYKGQIIGSGQATHIEYGTVNGLDTAGVMVKRGDWKATIGTCTVADRKAVLGAHRL